MKKKIVLAVLAVAAVGCAVAALLGMDYSEPEEAVMATGSEYCYVLRDYEGYVAVFVENDPNVPTTVTDIQTQTLRQVDKDSLKTGLKVVSQEKLMMMLEDLGS